MRKTVLTFGLICGAITTVAMVATLPFEDRIGHDQAEILGYTVIVLSALLVFFGIRSYRENVSGGRLTFGRGFAVGILITLISSFCYVATWEVLYFKFMPDFADKYAAHMTPKDAQQFKVMYNNPATNIALTFAEVFPVGLGVTLLSAAILRKPTPSHTL